MGEVSVGGRSWRGTAARAVGAARRGLGGRLAALWRPAGPPARRTTRGQWCDVLLALVIGLTVLSWALDSGADRMHDAPGRPLGGLSPAHSEIAAIAVTAVVTAALSLRRRYPLAVLGVVVAATALTPHDAQRLTFYALVCAAYTAAVHSPYRAGTTAGLVAAVAAIGTDGGSQMFGQPDVPPTVPTQYVPLLILVPLVFAAHGLRTWRLRTVESRSRMSRLEREQAERERRAAERERARIARELHDVITHNVSMMTIQAGAARKVMAVAPEEARTALLAVESAGRAALSELRHTMGLLAVDGDDREELVPQPDLGRLDALVARVRATGLAVRVTVAGEPREVPAGVGLTAYRVVQEALTNTVKHAAGAEAAVTVEYGVDRLRVEITDTGGTRTPAAAAGNALGIAGLRARATLFGGTLHTERRLTGGFRVVASLPTPPP